MPEEHHEATQQETDGIRTAHEEARGVPAARGGAANRSERLLEEIAEHIRVWGRQRSMEDFTLAKMAGAITQIVAVGMAFWAMLAMASPRPDVYPSVRWLAAIFFQLLAMTFFQLHRQR